jgi:dolichol kinase
MELKNYGVLYFLKNLKKLCDEKFEDLFKNYEDLMNHLQIYVIIMWLINLQIYSFFFSKNAMGVNKVK